MKIIIYLITILLFISCSEDDIVKTDGYKLTFNVTYSGDALVKRVNVAVFNYADGIDTKPPIATYMPTATDSYTFPETITLEDLKAGEYIAIIYGDVDPDDGKMKNEPGDPFIVTDKIVITDKDLSIDLELKDETVTPECESSKDCDRGETCNTETGKCESTLDPCSNTTCGDFGDCEVDGNRPKCVCDEGYHADMLTCVEDSVGVHKINFTVNYSGTESLKRVMVAYYVGEATGMPDKTITVPETPNEVLTFPYTFSLTPEESKVYNIKLKADTKTSGMPEHIIGGVESEVKEADVTETDIDLTFTLVDPS